MTVNNRPPREIGSPMRMIWATIFQSGGLHLSGTSSFCSIRKEITQDTKAHKFVAWAAPATPMAGTPNQPHMKTGSSTKFSATQTAFTTRTGRSSAMPLKPEASTPLAVKGSAPQTKPRRYSLPAASTSLFDATPSSWKYIGINGVRQRERRPQMSENQTPWITASPTPSRLPFPSRAAATEWTPIEATSPSNRSTQNANELAPMAASCAAPRRPTQIESMIPYADLKRPIAMVGNAIFHSAALLDSCSSGGSELRVWSVARLAAELRRRRSRGVLPSRLRRACPRCSRGFGFAHSLRLPLQSTRGGCTVPRARPEGPPPEKASPRPRPTAAPAHASEAKHASALGRAQTFTTRGGIFAPRARGGTAAPSPDVAA
mmetsp:Transcript_27039/g.89786  ORF Transcript_27039/g.89786 Transcript_27039/m.89786 type:complete len:375 (+) Transcript_27039:611-1735(+)